MFELIDGTSGMRGQFFEPDPDQEGTADVIALNAHFTTLATFQPCDLLAFAVQLLDLPAKATRLLGGLGGVPRGIVGHDPIRAVGRHLNPEQTHLAVFGKALDFDPLAVGLLVRVPRQRIHAPVRALAAGIIHLAVVLQRTVVGFMHRLDEQHQFFGCIPGIHQHRVKHQPLLMHHVVEHLMHVIELAFAIARRVIEAVVNQPERVQCRVDVDTGHHPNAFDHGFGVAAVLTSYQLDGKGSIFVQHRVIEDHVTLRGCNHLLTHVLPDQPWRDALSSQVAIDGIVTEFLAVVSKVRQRVVDLANQQILAIIKSCYRCFHTVNVANDPSVGKVTFA